MSLVRSCTKLLELCNTFLQKISLSTKKFSRMNTFETNSSADRRVKNSSSLLARRIQYNEIVVPSENRPHGCAVRRLIPKRDRSQGAKAARYATVQSEGRGIANGSSAVRQSASNVDHASRLARRLR